jgi:2-phosphoglycerate kinase
MKQKLILLNGFAGVGKSTIAQKYISETPLTLCLEGDIVMGMIGCW